MKKRLKPILIITVVLVILILLGILIRNKIIINKIYDLESKYKSSPITILLVASSISPNNKTIRSFKRRE